MQQLTFVVSDAACNAEVGTSHVATLPVYLSVSCLVDGIGYIAGVGLFH